jgi:putative ABC transport system substrate-binding protein
VRRRDFITLLGGAAAASSLSWPLPLRAQQPATPVIGVLHIGTLETTREWFAAFHRGLSETGYVEGRNLAVEHRWADHHNDRMPRLVAELVRRQVAVIVVNNTPAALAAKAATKSIPIVFSIGADPVEIGLVASLNRPGSNLTGTYNLNIAMAAKRLELLHELVPTATSIAYLVNPSNAVVTDAETRELQIAARTLGVHLLILNASDPSKFEAVFATLVLERVGALLESSDVLFSNHSDQLVALAARHRVPAMYSYREATAAGGLASYGTDRTDTERRIGVYTGRILKGEKPADLPVQQVTKIQLVINMKTAKALGMTFPLTLLGRADEVIE